MKLYELNENESLKVIEASRRLEKPVIRNHQPNPPFVELPCIQTKIFTDGQIKNEEEETFENVEGYYIGRIKYPHRIDTLKIRSLFLKDYSYAVVYSIANEHMTVGNLRGWFDVVRDVSVYLKNPNDRKALKNAKQIIKHIEEHNRGINYSSLFSMYASRAKHVEEFESKEISNNVYTLKRTNNK